MVSYRRVVTGRGPEGRSVVIGDTRVQAAELDNFNFWCSTAAEPLGSGTLIEGGAPFFPRADGTTFRIFHLPTADAGANPELPQAFIEAFFRAVGDPACRVDTRRHPLMHSTPTVDYIMLLTGQVSLLLDEGEPVPLQPFDVVVQRATNHAWLNTGTTTAVLMSVMVGLREVLP